MKTDKVDSDILALLLRADLIPVAYRIAPARRGPRDLMRTRLRLVEKSVSAQNSIDRLLEKFNAADVAALDELYRLPAACHAGQIQRLELEADEDKERLEGSMPNPLVAIDEGVILDEGERQRSGLGRQVGVEVLAAERHSGLCRRRFERTEVPNAGRAPPRPNQPVVKGDDLTEREVSHLGEASVQLAVLVKNPLGRLLKVGSGLGHEVADRGGGELVDGDIQTLRSLPEAALGIIGKLD